MIDPLDPTLASLDGVLHIHHPQGACLPLVIDSPHSGRDYPDDFGYSVDLPTLRSAEDAYVDELCADAPLCGATLLAAAFPRSYIDVNRDEDDIHPALLDGEWPAALNPGIKTAMGIGLVRAKLASGAEIYNRPLPVTQVMSRIERYYRPYHRALAALLDAAVDRFGAVWHIDMHSMASTSNAVTPETAGARRDFDIVLGNLDGASCEPGLTECIRDYFSGCGYRVRINDPYKGVVIVKRYGRPVERRHTIQIEINRALYLDESRVSKHDGFDTLRAHVGDLCHTLAEFVASRIGQR